MQHTAICLGLFAAWLANDVEEAVTMRADSQRLAYAAPAWLPVPEEVRERGVAQGHLVTGIAVRGGLVAAASLDGVRSEGRSPLFQSVLLGFGLHGFGHLAQAALGRRWTSGSLTSPTVVIPYWLWATWRLHRAGTDPLAHVSWRFVGATPLVIGGVHALAWGVRRAAGVRRPLVDEA